MKVRLTRKFAEFVNGVDLRHRRIGDVVDLSHHEAELLLAEDWAEPAEDASRAEAADAPRQSRRRIARKRPEHPRKPSGQAPADQPTKPRKI
jgi:hypothetical protein